MSEVTDLIVPLLQRVQHELTALARTVDLLKDDVQVIRIRLTSVEENIVAVNCRLDNFEVRLDRIERRIDLIAA